MKYKGSCHCGQVKFSMEGELTQVIECNCSHCSRKGYLLWFVDRDNFQLDSGENQLATYTFNKHVIKHHFCPACSCAPLVSARTRRAPTRRRSTCAASKGWSSIRSQG